MLLADYIMIGIIVGVSVLSMGSLIIFSKQERRKKIPTQSSL